MIEAKSKRSAGILLHITSLPSAFGIGDLGPEAYRFTELLHKAHQQYWQILPLNPVQAAQYFSPYSSISSMAGNTLLISPELLRKDGLITSGDLKSASVSAGSSIDYKKTQQSKNQLLHKAYLAFQNKSQRAFESFINREAFWLDDFALFMALKNQFRQRPWYEWPDPYRKRELKMLLKFTSDHRGEILEIKWQQFVFFQQWKLLRSYCNKLDVQILGDLPFYVNHDSVDVWAHPDIFRLQRDGMMKGVAGVPPDYFNANGQLWGMPVYDWGALKEQRYDWWVKRIRKNLELFDMLRLDHFRAFASYWEVPAGEKTAVNGKWRKGPGKNIFEVFNQDLKKLPFVAEDLGDISDDVYQLRDMFAFPGMKVIQFAFGDNMPSSDHIPHQFKENFFAYTGTHDNNTTRGWFRKELAAPFRKQLSEYAGEAVSEENVHQVLARLAYASIAQTVILPMQDVLGLGSEARMNTPASVKKNWVWKLESLEKAQAAFKRLEHWTFLYNRQ